jgi:hypothetical protein
MKYKQYRLGGCYVGMCLIENGKVKYFKDVNDVAWVSPALGCKLMCCEQSNRKTIKEVKELGFP